MMNRIIKYVAVLSFLVVLSCVGTDDFSVPTPNKSNNNSSSNQGHLTTFKAIHNRYQQAVNNGKSIAKISNDELLYIEGYVISSDASGNFFEELIIQNKTDASSTDLDPRLGLKISINVSSLSDIYEFGRKISVKLSGLTIGKSNGVITIGTGNAAQVSQIQAANFRDIITKTDEVANMTPKLSRIQDLTASDYNTLIKLNDMQFNRFDLGATFASESIDQFDGFRILESCKTGVSIWLETSVFSSFKGLTVPQGMGDITAIFSRDFRDKFNVLIVNNNLDINFNQASRCDPLEINCGETAVLGNNNLFSENFESQKNNKIIVGNGWTNYIEAGTQGWEGFSSTSSNASLGRSARFQSASSGDPSNIGWLITPPFNLDQHKGATLRFKTSSSLADGSFMEVLCSQDWDGVEAHINRATWQVLSAAYIVKDTDSFVPWFNSGLVDLSCLSGTVHIAFKYTGSGQTAFDGVYELDEVYIDYVN